MEGKAHLRKRTEGPADTSMPGKKSLAIVRAAGKARELSSGDFSNPQYFDQEQNLAALGRLVGSVAHDFNNLLTGITLCSELLAAGLGKNERLLKHVREIQVAGQHGAELVRQLITISGPRHHRVSALCLNQVISEMIGLLSRLVGENVRLETRLGEGLGQVEISSAHVLQIVLNLVVNARDAMPEGGRVILATRNVAGTLASAAGDCPGWVELSVCDTGAGMNNNTHRRLFERHFTTKAAGKGYGLGLATACSIVERCAGKISVESRPGKGARFCVLFPRLRENKILRIIERGNS